MTNLKGAEAVLQRLTLRLTTRLGSLHFAPEFGSRLYLLPREKPSARLALARAYVQEAVAEEREVYLDSVDFVQTGDRAALTAAFTWQGETLQLTLEGGNR